MATHRSSSLQTIPASAPLDSAEGPLIIPVTLLALLVVMIGMAAYGVTLSHMNFDYSPAAMATPGTPPDAAGQVRTNVFVPSLMFFTLGATVLFAIAGFVWSLRRRSNRVAAKEVLTR